MGQLIAETLLTRVLGDEAEVRAATALITVDVWASIYAGIPGRHACFIRLAGKWQKASAIPTKPRPNRLKA